MSQFTTTQCMVIESIYFFQFTLRVLPSCHSYQSPARVRAQKWTGLSCFTWPAWQVTKYSTFSTGCTGKLISKNKFLARVRSKILMFQISQWRFLWHNCSGGWSGASWNICKFFHDVPAEKICRDEDWNICIKSIYFPKYKFLMIL